MSLPDWLHRSLALPAICAPMFTISNAELVGAACAGGLVGALPRHNFKSREAFALALDRVAELTAPARDAGLPIGPVAVNLSTRLSPAELAAELALCRRYGVRILISAAGHPGDLICAAHDEGMVVWHDVTSRRFAEKAIEAGADGLIAIAAGGGGQSGTISPLALIPGLRRDFAGTIVLAGAVASGAAIRAAEILGADLAYLGTRFIATRESSADNRYKTMLAETRAEGVVRTERVNGVPASWLAASLEANGIDPTIPPSAWDARGRPMLPEGARPWKTVWSAGQGVELVDHVPSVAALIAQLRREYREAVRIPIFPGSRGDADAV